jgi:hypothetical protein
MAGRSDNDQDEPTIRFGNEWIPARDAWKKMETATVVVEAINRFNQNFPHLSSPDTRDVVPLVRQRLKDIQLKIPDRAEGPDFAAEATALLASLPPEDVVDAMAEKHGLELDLMQLVQMVGDAAYLRTLVREAAEFRLNLISPDQNAQLWNDARRPAPGGGLWTAQKVRGVLEKQDNGATG